MDDLSIAQNSKLLPIIEIAKKLQIDAGDLELYGNFKAKLPKYAEYANRKSSSKLVLVTAINPTPAGEGKTTTSIGLADALAKSGENVIAVLREPSLGPVFGVKGGATGGGYAQVAPMEDINLHFTGDFHAIGSANNLLAAMLDNHIKQGNELNIDAASISLKRSVDMNDRQLRFIESGLLGNAAEGSSANGIPRSDGFEITVASEVMAIFCLANDIEDLKLRLGKIVVAYNFDGDPITAADLKANGAMAVLLKDAIKPNLVQTLEGTPAIIHGGPFANIAHGCNSVIASKAALGLIEDGFAVTEAGFGADLGMEKFLDIKCRLSGLYPSAIVLVATIRALKHHGDGDLTSGCENLKQHISNIQNVYGLPAVVALNKFSDDTDEEIEIVRAASSEFGVDAILCDVWAKGSEGGLELARKVVEISNASPAHTFAYDLDQSIESKIEEIAKKIYHAEAIEFSQSAMEAANQIAGNGFRDLPICIAKTQYSFSDDAKLLGAPKGFTLKIQNIKLSAGAGFIVAIAGNIIAMPGLPKIPAATSIDISKDGIVSGLF